MRTGATARTERQQGSGQPGASNVSLLKHAILPGTQLGGCLNVDRAYRKVAFARQGQGASFWLRSEK
jgi:hypothetical protein